MIFLLVKWLYMFVLSYAYGSFILNRIKTFYSLDPHTAEEVSLVSLIGLVAISVSAAVLSFVMPIAGIASLILLFIALAFSWFDRSHWHRRISMHWHQIRVLPWYFKVFLVGSLLVMLYLSSQQSMTADEGGYYAETVKWLESYRIVPGLVNLHDRLAFNSHWHVLSAVFSFSFLTGQESNQINGFLYMLIALFFIQKLYAADWIRFELLLAALLVFMNLPHPFLAYYIVAPNADYAVILISWVIYLLMIDKSIKKTWAELDVSALLVCILAFFLITLKVSAFTLLACPLLLLVWQRKHKSRSLFLFCLLTGAVISLPWLVRNIILSGYLVFPINIDLFSFDWEYPSTRLMDLNEYIRTCAFNLYKPGRLESASLPFFERYSTWFIHNLRYHEQLIVALAFLSIPFHMFFWKKHSMEMRMLLLLIFASMLFWLLKVPDPRFGYTFLMFSVAAFVQLVVQQRMRSMLLLAVLTCAFAMEVSGVVLYTYFEKQFTVVQHRHSRVAQDGFFLMPKPYELATPDSVIFLNEGMPLNWVQDTVPYLWAMELPATGTLYEGLQQRGATVESGFKINN